MVLFIFVSLIYVTKYVTMIAKLVLFKKTDGRSEFMIRLTEKGKRGYRSINVPFTEKDWNYNSKKRFNELKKLRPADTPQYRKFLKNQSYVRDIEKKYTDTINNLIRLNKPFSFNRVFQLVEKPLPETPKTVYQLFEVLIKENRLNDQHGNADNLQGTLNKLKKYESKDMLFGEMDDQFLLSFKRSMLLEGKSKSTISIHLRNIRTLFNYAIKKAKVAKLDEYPFINDDIMKGLKNGYRSRAISKYEVDKIRKLKIEIDEGSDIWHACNYFLFGYLGRGMNFQDIARLKWENILQDRVRFIRYKTRSKIQEETNFGLTKELSEILAWYRKNNKQLGSPYVFPVLNSFHNTEIRIFNRIKKIRKVVNDNLKRVGQEIEAEIPLTTYTWRHTFAAVAKNDLKVDVSMISEMLGHHDLETTQHYLKQFPDLDKDNAVKGL